jgi:thiosulfate dehydrogenase [quinone] large subunit
MSGTLRQATLVIAAVAGLWTLFDLYWNLTSNTGRDFWGSAMVTLFVVALAVAVAAFAAERAALVANAPQEQFPEPAIARFFLGSAGSAGMWFVVRMYVGEQWLLAGIDKIKAGFNGAAIKGFAEGALSKAGGTHPSVQGWYASFLKDYVIPHSGAWALAITWGEFAVGLGLLVGALTGIAAGFGVLMNLNYLLSGTVSINPVLGVLGLFLVLSWRVCGWIGLDRVLLPAIGLPWKPGSLFGRPSDAARTPSNARATG